jgi:hypothetical protein
MIMLSRAFACGHSMSRFKVKAKLDCERCI